ncbi:9837_t:CDS:2, partial [Diversispora eburnea]
RSSSTCKWINYMVLKTKPELAPQKLNKHGKEYWKLSPDANKPHISSEYVKKVQDLMNDKEDYIIGIANDWEMGRMELQIQNDNNGTITGSKEEWIPGEKDKWGMEPHGWSPYMIVYCEGKININRLLRLDQIEYLFGPKINEDRIVYWHTQLPIRVNFKMASEIKILLHYATEYTLFTKIWMDNGTVEEGIADNGWHFGKKKKAGSLTGEEITPGQLMGIDEYLWEKTREYVSHICYELRPVPISQGGTKRAKGLTPAYERALVEFNEKVLKPGCNLKDLHILEKDEKNGGLGMKIIVKDILGNEMWNSNLECERALASACTKTKEGKVNIDDKKIAEALISFVARELPKATRVWIIGKEILTHEGILYRSSHEWEKLIKAFEYEKSQFIPEELLKWRPLKAEYNELEKFLEGAQSYRFRCWREREGIEPTPRNAIEIWQQSQVESMVWNAPINPAPKHIHIDLRGVYLSCEDSERSASEALPWVRRYGFPKQTQRRACVENIEAIRCLTGVVQLVAWEFAKNLHPFTARLIGQHLTEKEGARWLISATPREIIYSVDKKSRIEFPSDRDLAVRFVGSSIPETILDESKLKIDFDESLYINAKNDIELEEVHKKYNAEINKIKKQYESVIVLDTPEIKYGQWRKKKPGYIYRKEASSWTINHKTNLLAEYHRKQNPGLITMTYHKYFHLGATAIDEWDPACLGKKTLAEILIFDEACMIPRKVLQRFPHKFFTEWADEVIWCMEDYRVQDDELKVLKLRMWMKNDLAQLLEFRKAIPKTTWENALAQWTPNDI